jgi:4-amino-4-deoxy-L-arabinose transferase-like glycosyltransferase
VAESFLIFFLLLAKLGHWYAFAALAAAAGACWKICPRVPLAEAAKRPLGKGWIAAAAALGAYGIWYFINALAPEVRADGISYHLGLPYEYVRLGGFPSRITFYDMVPQGMEMLYTAAFSVGRHSAAKLVEFAFFLATLPLFFRMGRRLQMSDLASLVAAAFYFCAPVAGVTGASSYNDAAGVFFALAAFYLLLVWRDTGESRYLLPAGALAGFCFAIKSPGAMVAVAAVLLVLWFARAIRPAAVVALGAALVMAPWLVRNALLTGNPLAPLLNSVFPNPYFHAATERELGAVLRSFGDVAPWRVPWQLAFGDKFQGTFGPLLLALPLGLVALRRRAGRWCWTAAALLAVPWFWNTGARFLMPSVAVAGLALGMALPGPAAWAAVILQAALSWPQVIGLRDTPYTFRLHEFPLAAALRREPETAYLSRTSGEFQVAQMIEAKTPPDAKILALVTVANAYLARDVRVAWQSAEGDVLLDALRLAGVNTEPMFAWKTNWPIDVYTSLRIVLPQSSKFECDIDELRIYSGDDLVYTSPHWTARAWPNAWETPLALDGYLATRWRTWQPVRAGNYFEVAFDRPQRISSLAVYSHAPALGFHPEVYGMPAGQNADKPTWHDLGPLLSQRLPPEDLRLQATRAIRRAGYGYLLAPTGAGGAAPIGNAILGEEGLWGLAQVGRAGPYYLFRVK